MTDIQFGDVEYQGPQTAARPDQDAHFAVVECGQLNDGDLPIYVDLDVLRDMEGHARSNTNVELGGVMLGGQYVDDQGRPFVVVSDSLRAEHFEATKGSFKFTHETWQEITRRREEFSDDLQMVGWYHTHPDWGVFLSGMDLFICDHFFNRPLDVALVIDPCRDDRGWFQWTTSNPPKTLETGGFYLMTNRFREDELNFFNSMYSGDALMSSDPRYSGGGGSIVQPVVNINDQRTPLVSVAIMGMLTIQLIVLGLLGYKLLGDDNRQTEEKLSAVENQLMIMGQAEKMRAQQQAYTQAISALTGSSGELADMTDRMMATEMEKSQLEADYRGQAALAKMAEQERNATQLQSERRQRQIDKLNTTLKSKDEKIEELTSKVNEDDKSKLAPVHNWVYYVAGGILGILGLAGGYWLGMRNSADDFDDLERPAKPEFGSGVLPGSAADSGERMQISDNDGGEDEEFEIE